MATYFVIVGKGDTPLYELDFSAKQSQQSLFQQQQSSTTTSSTTTTTTTTTAAAVMNEQTETQTLKQFILHASLDVVDELQWTQQNLFLHKIDKYNDYAVSCHITAGYVKFLLLFASNDKRMDEGSLKQFFNDVNELYLKIQLNPFYEPNSQITNRVFDQKVRSLASRYLYVRSS